MCTQELRKPVTDVVGELLRLSRRPDSVPSPRAQLLMAACGLRLDGLDTLLMLLPLTAVVRYIEWFDTSARIIHMRRTQKEGMDPAAMCGGPVNASMAARFKDHLKAHPRHLGMYAIMAHSGALQVAVFGDDGCAPAYAGLPGLLLATVQTEYGGVLPHSLWLTARMACGAASRMDSFAAFVEAQSYRAVMRLCLLPMALASDSPELLLLEALRSVASCCSSTPEIAPLVLEDLAGPCRELLPHLSSIFRQLIKGARTGRPVEPAVVRAGSSFCTLLHINRTHEEMPTEWRRALGKIAGLNEDAVCALKAQAHHTMEALRGSLGLWGLLRDLHEAMAEAAAAGHTGCVTGKTAFSTGLLGLGTILGAVPMQEDGGLMELFVKERVLMENRTEADAEAQFQQQLEANSKRLERMFCQVSAVVCVVYAVLYGTGVVWGKGRVW